MSHLEIATTHDCCCILANFASGQGLAFHALHKEVSNEWCRYQAPISRSSHFSAYQHHFLHQHLWFETENIAGAMLTACTFALAGALVLKNRGVTGALNNNPIALALCILSEHLILEGFTWKLFLEPHKSFI